MVVVAEVSGVVGGALDVVGVGVVGEPVEVDELVAVEVGVGLPVHPATARTAVRASPTAYVLGLVRRIPLPSRLRRRAPHEPTS